MCLFYTFSNTYPRLFVCLFVCLFIGTNPLLFHYSISPSYSFASFILLCLFTGELIPFAFFFFITLKVNPYLRCVCSAKAPTVKFISLFKGVLYNHKLFSLFLKIIIIYSTLRCRDLTY